MNKNKYTVKQVMDSLGVSKTTIYAWINKNKIEYEETPKGKIILLSDEEIENLKESYKVYSNQQLGEQSINYNVNQIKQSTPVNASMNEVIFNMLNQIDKYHQESIKLAEQAGQVKLLTDNQTYYQNEYFKIKLEAEQLIKVNTELTQELLTLKQENEQLKKSSWQFWKK